MSWREDERACYAGVLWDAEHDPASCGWSPAPQELGGWACDERGLWDDDEEDAE